MMPTHTHITASDGRISAALIDNIREPGDRRPSRQCCKPTAGTRTCWQTRRRNLAWLREGAPLDQPSPAAASLIASLYSSAVLRGKKREKLRALCVSVVESYWFRPPENEPPSHRDHREGTRLSELLVGILSSASDLGDDYYLLVPYDGVHNAIVTDPDPVVPAF